MNALINSADSAIYGATVKTLRKRDTAGHDILLNLNVTSQTNNRKHGKTFLII
jgi:hypothetical protein